MAKSRSIPENTWYDWLIDHIPEPMKIIKATPNKYFVRLLNQKHITTQPRTINQKMLQTYLKVDYLITKVRKIKTINERIPGKN